MSRVEINKFDEMGYLTVFIDGLSHLKIMCKVNAFHSYIDEKRNPEWKSYLESPNILPAYNLYYIEFHLDNSVVKCTYNDRELWETILKGLG